MYARLPGSGAVIMIADSGMLMGEVMQSSIRAASRRIAAVPPTGRRALLGVGLLLGAVAIWWCRSGKAGRFLERARPVVRELGQIYGPPLMETFSRYERGQVAFAQAAVPPADAATLAERIARVLAFCPAPVLAEDIARELGAPGNLRDRTRLVREELRGCGAFSEVSRGRWMLGQPSGYQAAPLPFTEVADYMIRLHKDTRQRPATKASG